MLPGLTILEDLDKTITKALSFTKDKCTAVLQPIFKINVFN